MAFLSHYEHSRVKYIFSWQHYCVLSPCFYPEFYMAPSVLLRPVYGHESHALYRIRCPPSRGHDWRLAHHDQYGRGGHLLRHVPGSCDYPGAVLGCVTSAVSREGNHLCTDLKRLTNQNISTYTFSCFFPRELHVDANVILAVRFNITAMFYIISLLTCSYFIGGSCAKGLENMCII